MYGTVLFHRVRYGSCQASRPISTLQYLCLQVVHNGPTSGSIEYDILLTMSFSRPNLPAPSSTLLRFLRSQSDTLHLSLPRTKRSPCRWSKPGTRLKDVMCSQWLKSSPPGWRPGHASLFSLKISLAPFTTHSVLTRSGLHGQDLVPKVTSRNASTCNESWLRRLWGLKRRGEQRALKPDDLPPLTSFLDEGAETSMFSLGRSLAGKASNELKLRCTEFDDNGNVTLVNGEFKKSELIAKVAPVLSSIQMVSCSPPYALVWSPSERSSQNRLISSPAHPCPTFGDPY